MRITPDNGVETLAQRFINEIIRIAKLVKIPKFPTGIKTIRKSKQLLLNLARRGKLEQQIRHPQCREKDRADKEGEIETLNTAIQEEHERERERKEVEAVGKIKLNLKEFYKFTNKTKNTRSKIGPLRVGEKYYSGVERMARILSDQYKSKFSKPRDNYDNIQFIRRTMLSLSEIELAAPLFVEAMQSMKMSSAPGPDGVPAYLYY